MPDDTTQITVAIQTMFGALITGLLISRAISPQSAGEALGAALGVVQLKYGSGSTAVAFIKEITADCDGAIRTAAQAESGSRH